MSKPLDVNNLKFGDKLRTRDGKMAIYLKAMWDGSMMVAVKPMKDNCYLDKYLIHGDILVSFDSAPINNDLDIIGYWED